MAVLLAVQATAGAQPGVLTLDNCRRLAMENNRSLKQAALKCDETKALERAALWEMLPSVSAVGGYVWTERSVNLLSEEQKDRLGHLGDNLESDISAALHSELSEVPLFGDALADRLDNVLIGSRVGDRLNSAGQGLVDELETDTRHMGAVAVTLTQPIYVGGKLLALHRSAELLNHLAGVELGKEEQDVLVSVDEAYWQVVSVQQKLALASRYAALLDTLERNVMLAVEAETATLGDLAQVRVKKGEAQMNLTKATNGLALAKMLLAERCGLPVDTEFEVETGIGAPYNAVRPAADVATALENRAEMRMLRISDSLAQQGVRVAASALKPNIVATAGYMASNPNVFNGFSNSWGGTWMAGVVAQVPLFHPAGAYAVKAAKAKRMETQWKMKESEELIALQVSKLRYGCELSAKKLAQAESNLTAAEENLRLADASYKAGVCSSSDLMAAQTAWMQAEGEVLDAQIELEMDNVYLKQAMGL